MRTHWKKWMTGVLSLALALPIAGTVYAQEAADDRDPPREEQRDEPSEEQRDEPREDRDAPRDEQQDQAPARERDDADDRDAAPAREESEKRNGQTEDADREERGFGGVRAPRSDRQDNRDLQDDRRGGSPSDLQRAPERQPRPIPQQQAQMYSQGNCCCGNGAMYSNNGYRSARVNNNGYRSYSYQGGEAAVAAPVYTNTYSGNAGYYNNGGYYYNHGTSHIPGVPSEANPRNFSGSYGSRATLHHGR